MGYYIQGPIRGKADHICVTHGAVKVTQPQAKDFDPEDTEVYVCVVKNMAFDAAAVCYIAAEISDLADPHDARPKTWLKMNKALAYQLSGYRGS